MTDPEPELDRLHPLRDDHIGQRRTVARRLGGDRLRALRDVTEPETALGIGGNGRVTRIADPPIGTQADRRSRDRPSLVVDDSSRPVQRLHPESISAFLALRSKSLGF